MTTQTRRREKNGKGVGAPVSPSTSSLVVEKNLPADPIHQRGSLTMQQAVVATRATHKQDVQDRLEAGKVIPLPWSQVALIFRGLDLLQELVSLQEYGLVGLREAIEELMEVFPYDQERWQSHHQFTCLKNRQDMNGQPPSVGLVVLPIDKFRRPRE